MLNGTLIVHGVDAEKHAASVMRRAMAALPVPLQPVDQEELLSHLVIVLWRIGETYDVSRDRNPNFKSYSGKILADRVNDWYRTRFVDKRYDYGDSVQRDAIAFPHSLDAPVGRDDDGIPQRFGDLVAVLDGSDTTDWHEARGRLERERDSHRARDLAVLRRGLSERTATRARRAAA